MDAIMDNKTNDYGVIAFDLNAKLWRSAPRTGCVDYRVVPHPMVRALQMRCEETQQYEEQRDETPLNRWKVEYARPAPHRVQVAVYAPETTVCIYQRDETFPSREHALQFIRSVQRACWIRMWQAECHLTPIGE
jgi:hypothetical protein